MSDRFGTPVIALAVIACSGLALIVCGIGAFGLARLVQGSSAPDVTDGSRGPRPA